MHDTKEIDAMEAAEELDQTTKEISDITEKSFNLNNFQGENVNSVWEKEIQAQIDKQTLKNLFLSDDWVFIIVDLIANKISSQVLQVVKKVVEGDQISIDPVPDHKLLEVFEQPNKYQDYHSWMYNQVVEDTLMGNDVMWWDEKKRQIMILPADQVSITFDNEGEMEQYIVSTFNVDEFGQVNEQSRMTFDADDIMHVRRPNPKSLLWGLSPFLPGKSQLLFNRYTMDYLNSFYLKQATPGMALEMDREAKEDIVLRQLKSFEQAYTGRSNARRTLILPKGVTAKAMSHTLADQRIVEMIDKNRETILAILKVPKHEVGLQTSGSLGSEEHKIAIRNFWGATLKPACKRISGTMTKFFRDRGELAENESIVFDLSDIPILQDDEFKKAETAEKMAKTLTINEVRQRVWQEEPLDMPTADIPLALLGKAVPVQQQERPQQAEAPTEDDEGAIEDKALDVAFNKAGIDVYDYVKKLDETTEKSMDQYLDNSSDMIGDMAEIAIRLLEKHFKALKTKADDDTQSEKEERLRKMREELSEEFGDLEDKFVADHTNTLSATVEVGYDQQLTFIMKEPDAESIVALKEPGKKQRRAVLEARGIESFAWIGKTQSERIMKKITEGVEKGDSLGKIRDQIASTFKEPEKMLARASTIARTETLTALSMGQWASTLDAAKFIPGLKKVWINLQDNRVRGHPSQKPKSKDANHWKMHKETRTVNKKFSNGLLYPRQPTGDADEIINCRCAWLTLPPDQKIPEGVDSEN